MMGNENDGRVQVPAVKRPEDDTKLVLRGSEERLRFALLGAGAGMWDWDVKSGRMVWDKAYYELFGLETSVKPCFENWLASIHPDDREHAQQAVRETFGKKDENFRIEFRIRHPVKGERWLSGMGHATYARDGSPARMTGVNVDITERRRAELETEELGRQRQLALSAAQMGWWHFDPASGVVTGDERMRKIFCVTLLTINVEEIFNRMHPEDEPRVRAAVAAAINPADPQPYQIEYRVCHPDGSVLWVEAHGLATFQGGGETRRVSSFVGTVVDISGRKRADEALRESVEFSSNVIRSMQDGFSVLDARGVHVEVNPSLCSMTGFSRGELLGSAPPHYYWPPEEYERIQAAFTETLRGNVGNFELIFMRRNGERFPVIVSPFAIKNSKGETINYSATVKEITERKQMEEALRTSEQSFHTLAEASPVGIFRADANGQTTYVNRRLCEIVGLESAAALGSGWMQAVHPEDRDALARERAEAARADRESRAEYRLVRPDGAVVWVFGQAVPEHHDAGALAGYVGTVADITAQKQAETHLRDSLDEMEERVQKHTADLQASEERFRQVVQNINEVFWMSDVETKQILFISSGYEKIWGRTCASLHASPREWIEAIHPVDHDRVLLAAQQQQVSGDYDEEYRIIRPDGTERWVRDRAFPIRNEQGVVYRIAGIAYDITERKNLQRDLNLAIEREQERIGQDLHDGICQILTGVKFRIALLGQKLSGWTPVSELGDANAIETLLDQAIEQARDIARGLNPVKAGPDGLMESLLQLAASVGTDAGPRCACHIPWPVSIFDRHDAMHLYRIAQEAVQNALKHASAKTITIELTRRAESVTLTVSDDGRGLTGWENDRRGFGLSNMRLRAAMMEGRLEITGKKDGGAQVACHIQRPANAQERKS